MFNDIGLYDPVWASQYMAVHVVWEGLALVVTYRQQVSVTRCDSWSSHHSPSVGDQSPWCVDWNRPPSTHLSFVLTPLSYSSVCYRLNVCPPQNSSVEVQSANMGWWWGMRHHGGGQEVRALWSKIGKPMKVVPETSQSLYHKGESKRCKLWTTPVCSLSQMCLGLPSSGALGYASVSS